MGISVMKAEILATIGPASIGIIKRLYDNGLSGIRINNSHGTVDFHLEIIEKSRRFNPDGFIVYDIKGPKIRIGDLPEPLRLKSGERITFNTALETEGAEYPQIQSFDDGIPLTFDKLDEYVKEGDRFYIDDGFVGLKVLTVGKKTITCEVLYGDVIRSRKGLNHPDTVIGYAYTMPQDIPDLEFAISNHVDFVADSFTRDGSDVLELKERLQGTNVKIVSKIENPEGVSNFDDILEKTDAIMIARGDLGVEVDPWLLPELQKVMIQKCNKAGKPVVTATQMLESMIENPRPSRADVSDIANALYDGSDVIMLSGETSIGKFPGECVAMVRKIAEYVEGTERFKKVKKGLNTLKSLTPL